MIPASDEKSRGLLRLRQSSDDAPQRKSLSVRTEET